MASVVDVSRPRFSKGVAIDLACVLAGNAVNYRGPRNRVSIEPRHIRDIGCDGV